MATRHEVGLGQYVKNVGMNTYERNNYNKALSRQESKYNKSGKNKAFYKSQEFKRPSKLRIERDDTRGQISTVAEEIGETLIQDGGLIYGNKNPDIQEAKKEIVDKKMSNTAPYKQGFRKDAGYFSSGFLMDAPLRKYVLTEKFVDDDEKRLNNSSVDETNKKKYNPEEHWTGKGRNYEIQARHIVDDGNLYA